MPMKRLIIILTIALFITTGTTDAQTAQFQVLDKTAAEAYASGNYYYAIELYDSIYKQGLVSAPLFYNMGNAYFKTNQMPYAILFYEKALKIAPSDPQTQFNLNLANTLITDKIETIPLLFYQQWWLDIYTALSADSWAKTALVFISLFFIFLALYLVSGRIVLKKISFYLFIVMFGASALALTCARKQFKQTYNETSAIVFSPRVTAKSSPDDNSVDLFVIHEGTKVHINDYIGDWYEIRLANGNVGWIKKVTVKPI